MRHERVAGLLEAYRSNGSVVFILEKLQGSDILTYLSSKHEYTEQTVAMIVTQVNISITLFFFTIHSLSLLDQCKFVLDTRRPAIFTLAGSMSSRSPTRQRCYVWTSISSSKISRFRFST